MKIPAPTDSGFDEEAVLNFIGGETRIVNDERTAEIPAKIIDAKVTDGGKTMTLTLEVEDE